MNWAPPRPVTPAGILAARLVDLAALAGTVDAGGPLTTGLREVSELAGGLDSYLERHTTPESPALRRLAERTRAHDWSGGEGGPPLEREMLSGHVQGQVLKMLVAATRARTVLEIGMFTGYSALAMAEGLPPDGRLVACELDANAVAFAREGFKESPAGGKIEVRVGRAADTLAELADAGAVFDLVFLDADKPGYPDYLGTLLETGLLARGGLVCVDNTLMQGEPWTTGGCSANGAAIAAFNDTVTADPRVVQALVPLRDGLTLIRRAGE
ncbi:O-methyltransferase [Amycolatopsis sp. cmx-4-83]|uniref:O-methyltransferase n=1 Tax=Amycolatopsis sp. cmx-4-83 TaxID=2790940 RepID=UPI003977EED1